MLGGDEREAPCWSLHVVQHPAPQLVGLRRVLLPGVAVELCRDGLALGPGALADPRMSRRHCRIEATDGDALLLRDHGSSNGTWVNGVFARQRALDVDDVVRAGSLLLAVQRAPATYPAVDQGPVVAMSWAMARVLDAALRAPPAQRIVALHGEPATGVDDVARAMAEREGRELVRVAAVPERAPEGRVTLVGPLPCPDAATIEALRRATPSNGRLVLWVETTAREAEPDVDGALSALTGAAWRVPPLRERVVDLPRCIERLSLAVHGRAARVHHRLMVSLLRSPWPGNLDQLRDFVRDHLAPPPDDEPLRWSDAVVEPLSAQRYLERSAEGDDGPRAPPAAVYRVARDGRWFELPDGARVMVHPRRALVRLLGALAEHRARSADGTVPTAALVDAGWPGERLVGLSGPGRVYVALSTLRKLGLRDVLERCDDGYRLDGARVELSS